MLVLANNQTQTLDLLKKYNPNWEEQGKSFGERLLAGIKSKTGEINSAIAALMAKVNNATNSASQKISDASNSISSKAKQVITPSLQYIPPAPAYDSNSQSNLKIPASTMFNVKANDTIIYLDGRQIASSTAPVMVDMLRKNLGVNY